MIPSLNIATANTATAMSSNLRTGREEASSEDDHLTTPVQRNFASKALWRVMSILCLLWLLLRERSTFGVWPLAGAACSQGVATVIVATLLIAPSLIQPAERLRQAIAGGAALLIVLAFTSTLFAKYLAPEEANFIFSLATSFLGSSFLPMLAVIALGFALPFLLMSVRKQVPSSAPPFALSAPPFLLLQPPGFSRWPLKRTSSAWIWRGLDVLAAAVGLFAFCYIPAHNPLGLADRVILVAVVVAVAGLALWAVSYRGNLILESTKRGVEFLIPERLVRGVLAGALFVNLGVLLLAAFHSVAFGIWFVLLFVLWVVAHAAMPLLQTASGRWGGLVPRDGTATSEGHQERVFLCIGAIAALSGLLCGQTFEDAVAAGPFILICLLLVLAAIGVAVFGVSKLDRQASSSSGMGSWEDIAVRLDEYPETLPVDAALPRLDPRAAKVLSLLIRRARHLRQVEVGLERLFVQSASAISGLLSHIPQKQLMVVMRNIAFVFALCWIALKDWLTSDAQAYPYLTSLAATLAVGGAAIVARRVRCCSAWRDVVLAVATAFCLLALVLPSISSLVSVAVPAMGLLSFAFALPLLVSQAWRSRRNTYEHSSDQNSKDGLTTGGRPSNREAFRKLLLTPVPMKSLVEAVSQPASRKLRQFLLRPVHLGSLTKLGLLTKAVPQTALRRLRQILLIRIDARHPAKAPALFNQVASTAHAFGRLPRWIQSLLSKEVALKQPSWRRIAWRPQLSNRIASLLYGIAALVGAGTLILAPSITTVGWLLSLLAVSCTVVLILFCAQSPWPAARVFPFIVWGLCGFLYAYPAITGTGFGVSLSDIRGAMLGMGLSNGLSWDGSVSVAEQGWITWAIIGFIMLWMLDRNTQSLAAHFGNTSKSTTSKSASLEAEPPSGAVELSAGAVAALVALLLSGQVYPAVLAICVASLVISARPLHQDAVADPAEEPTRAAQVSLTVRVPIRAWLALTGTALIAGFVFLGAVAWPLISTGEDAGTASFIPLLSVPRTVRQAVSGDLPVAASWQDGDDLLRHQFGSRVAVRPSMSAAVALNATGADTSSSLFRAATAALLAPLIGHWLPAARIEELYLNDRDYGLPINASLHGIGQGKMQAGGLQAATEYYFHKPPRALSPQQARFLVGDTPAFGVPFRFTHIGLVPTLLDLNTSRFRLATFVTLVPGFEFAHHDGSLNNRGIIASSAQTADGMRSFIQEAGQMRMLLPLTVQGSAFAVKINDAGQAVGWSFTEDEAEHATLWEANGQVRDLGTLPGYTESRARGINRRGEVVGYAFNNTSEADLQNVSRAFLWEKGRIHDLDIPPECTSSRAYAINDTGQIAGWVMVDGGTHAAVWENGRVQDLGAFSGGQASAATAINNAGQVVGSAQHKSGRVTAFLWENGILHDLGVLPGDIYSSARDINDLGQIVGVSRPDLSINAPGGRAFVWDGGHGMRDLSTLVDAAAPLRKGFSRDCQSLAINNRDQVLGVHYDAGARHTFLMTPASQDRYAVVPHPISGKAYRLVCVNGGRVISLSKAPLSATSGVIQWLPNGGSDQEWVAKNQENGFWVFVNRGSGQCLEAASPASVPGGATEQAELHGNVFQQWSLRPVVDGNWKLVNRGSKLFLGVKGSSTKNGAIISQGGDTGGLNQHWLLQPVR